ncbi:CD209 antigen-like protein E isoform X1 [Labrus mixtus]|uniref:CD209 antigen-like protein E isoform X1 n=1 Tax=Labrus mixtus TaxID=508554 RepID=UPI0029C0851E|nr:CD209 antigen-like protein E isoform X1 [Labrus mixtus]
MESEEQIYINIEELKGDRRYRPEETETKPVRTDAVAGKQTETWTLFKVSTVCLGLLCFLLLTTAIAISVLYKKDFNQLSRDLANHTAENHRLLVQNQNLTDERDKFSLTVGKCPDGWRRFSCSCYLFSTSVTTWSYSKQMCQHHGADLVIINSQREMVRISFQKCVLLYWTFEVFIIFFPHLKMFLNKVRAHSKFWIGLDGTSSSYSSWKWADGSSLKTTYWQDGHPRISNMRYVTSNQKCAAFNSFAVGLFMRNIKSWTNESCNQFLRSVCEKEADMSLTSW